MVDSTLSPPIGLPADVAQPTGFLHTLLTMSLTAVAVMRPLFAEDGETIRDFAWVSLNPAGQRMLGQPACPTASLLTLFPAAQQDGVFAVCCRAFETGEQLHNQTNYQADGLDGYFVLVAQRYEQLLVVNFTDTNEQSRSMAEVALRESQIREQQARARAEAALAEAERQRTLLYQVLRQAPAYVATFTGPTHIYSFFNEPFREVLTQGRAQVGQAFADLFPELVEQGFLAVLDGVYTSGQDFEVPETEIVQRDPQTGQERTNYAHVLYKPLQDEHGRTQGLLAFATDITAQVVARQQLEQLNQELEARVLERTHQLTEQQALLRRILGQVPAAVATLQGPEQRYTFFNAQYQRLANGRAAYGVPMGEAIPEAAAQGFVALLDQVYQTGQPFVGNAIPIELQQSDGPRTEHYFDFVFQPLPDATQQEDSILAFAVEVTEQVQARQQVQLLNEELAAINEELRVTNDELHTSNTHLTRTNVDLDNFIYTASHDLKAPITNIEGLLLALEHELPEVGRTGDVPAMLAMMQGAVDRFRRTINNLTDLSRLQKEHSPANEAVSLASVVEEVRLDLVPLLTQTQGKLTVTIMADISVPFAEKNLRSVVYNLLSNAFKYRHPDRQPEVYLRSWPAGDYIMLEVQDNGLGLDLSQGQERLFAMFQRLHTHVEGTGVGLYMVKRILENAGGRIEVSSQIGQGTTFRVYFKR